MVVKKENIKPKKTRGRLSKIDTLPEDIRALIIQLLKEKKESQATILAKVNALLAEEGLELISRGSLNRYSNQIFKKSAQVLEAQEAAKQLVGKLGSSGSELSRCIIEITRALVFDVAVQENLDPEIVTKLALSIQRLELAEKTSVEREEKIRELVREEQKKAIEEAYDNGELETEAMIKISRLLGF